MKVIGIFLFCLLIIILSVAMFFGLTKLFENYGIIPVSSYCETGYIKYIVTQGGDGVEMCKNGDLYKEKTFIYK